jgi:hypothetical protein
MKIITNMLGMPLLAVFFLLGTVDQVEGEIVSVEITGLDKNPTQSTIHISFFPCAVKEGDVFYYYRVDGVTELRCGEPPE